MKYIKEFFTLPLEEKQVALSHVATQKGLPLIKVFDGYGKSYQIDFNGYR